MARLRVPVDTVGDAVKVVLDMGGGGVSVGVTDGFVSPPLELVGPVRIVISILITSCLTLNGLLDISIL